MKKRLVVLLAAVLALVAVSACSSYAPTSNDIQRQQQEQLLQEGTAQTGMPDVKNFRERKLMKDIIEMRDQEGLVTYTYVENAVPKVVPGKTALGGKFTFLGQSVGYAIPYATEFTSPEAYQRVSASGGGYSYVTLPQADPNGLFSPASADGTWVVLKDPNSNATGVVYVEPKIAVFPYELTLDQ